MKILIATGLEKSDIGGPFQYAHNLKAEFEKLGNKVKVAKYGSIEGTFLGIWPHAVWADKILALDTFSVGVPAVLAGKLLGKKTIVRVCGDFLWSAYVNRTGVSITLPEFYKSMPALNTKEKIIFHLYRWAIRNAGFLAFNTEWQRSIWEKTYDISYVKSGVVRNFIPARHKIGESANPDSGKNFLWAGRVIPEKNPGMLRSLGVDIVTGEAHARVLEKIKNSYAVTSLAFTDICPNFVIEGISFGKPFVMTRETGLDEIFPKGGIFVDPLDEKQIKEAMQSLRDENTYNKYTDGIKSLNLSHSWARMAEEFLSIWKKI